MSDLLHIINFINIFEDIYDFEALTHVYFIKKKVSIEAEDLLNGETLFGYRLKFKNKCIDIWANGYDDTIILNFEDNDDLIVEEYSMLPEWSKIIGLKPFSAQTILNQNGYNDGMQMNFIVDDKSDLLKVQFVVVCSKIKVYIFNEAV